MNKLITLLVISSAILFFLPKANAAPLYRCKSPIKINGLVYNVDISYFIWGARQDSAMLSIDFYLVCAEKGGSLNLAAVGGYLRRRSSFRGKLNGNYAQSREYPTRLLKVVQSDFLPSYLQCFPVVGENALSVVMFNGNNDENIILNAAPVSSSLMELTSLHLTPRTYIDAEFLANRIKGLESAGYTGDRLDEQLKKFYYVKNYVPQLYGNIDVDSFPNDPALLKILTGNREFSLSLNQEFYFEILRYRSIGYKYDERKIKDLMRSYDGNYNQYINNEFTIKGKVRAFLNLLDECVKNLNLGAIFYRDIDFTLGKYDFESKSFPLFDLDFRDGFFGAKKILGETSMMLSSKGADVHMSNWVPFSDYHLDENNAKTLLNTIGNQRNLKTRIYFLITTFPAIDEYENFRGVMAYALKGIIYQDCANNPLGTIGNDMIAKILDPEMRKNYSNAISYLESELSADPNDKYKDEIEGNKGFGYTNLANWNTLYNCERGYFAMDGKFSKKGVEKRGLTLNILTNLYYQIKPGYEIRFSNNKTGVSLPLIISSLSQFQMNGKAMSINLYLDITKATLQAMIAAKINQIDIQIAGNVKYNYTGNTVYNGNPTIATRLNTLGTVYQTDKQGNSNLLINFLKEGL
jgi:hypothetical protein